ncbi:MAG: biosynthetic arginine decarboxylase [Gammaproteobacteria bacterium]
MNDRPSPSPETEAALARYSIGRWGAGYFGVNAAGHLTVQPRKNGVEIDLAELADRLVADGFQLPVLVRFGDILRRRIAELTDAFNAARSAYGYAAPYTVVYPIKVNQERHVIREIVRVGPDRLGLEAGSKPELLAVLGLARRGSIIVVNGYKDRECIRLALAGQLAGYRVYVVIEKPDELDLLLEEAAAMQIEPTVGIRIRLANALVGKWQDTSGEKSKFGLNATEVIAAIERLRAAGKLDWLRLMHVHLGSQIANIRDIQRGMAEVARYYTEVRALGAPIEVVDVGGGLGVDYEGSRSRSDCSANYGFGLYAEVIVRTLAEVAGEAGQPVPAIISESGRALTAHHAVLVTKVIETERVPDAPAAAPADDAPAALRNLWEAYEYSGEANPQEIHADAAYEISEIHSLFSHGLVSLAERAQAEVIYAALCRRVLARINPNRASDWEFADHLIEKLADRMFINLSIFQSVPDAWAIDQVFPIVPLARLNETPTRRAVLHDLTCDSDGRIEAYVDNDGVESTLAVHEPDGKPYLLGIFMVGAYQEILGDMHNLFGDTNAVNVLARRNGYSIRDTREGDSAEVMLRYVHIPPRALARNWRRRLAASGLDSARQAEFASLLERGLKAYTYLDR